MQALLGAGAGAGAVGLGISLGIGLGISLGVGLGIVGARPRPLRPRVGLRLLGRRLLRPRRVVAPLVRRRPVQTPLAAPPPLLAASPPPPPVVAAPPPPAAPTTTTLRRQTTPTLPLTLTFTLTFALVPALTLALALALTQELCPARTSTQEPKPSYAPDKFSLRSLSVSPALPLLRGAAHSLRGPKGSPPPPPPPPFSSPVTRCACLFLEFRRFAPFRPLSSLLPLAPPPRARAYRASLQPGSCRSGFDFFALCRSSLRLPPPRPFRALALALLRHPRALDPLVAQSWTYLPSRRGRLDLPLPLPPRP
ncbi:hypothetical protein FIBSPDRAFT_968506, partial [Athelia psychrophila]